MVNDGLEDNVIITRNEKRRDHAPDREFAAAERIEYNLKQVAVEDKAKGPSGILWNILDQTETGIIAHLPPRTNLCRSSRTAKRKTMPPNPTSIDLLQEVPEAFQQTLRGDRFLMWDFRGRGQITGRVLVFSTKRNIELLASSEIWFVDGTFKVRKIIINIIFSKLTFFSY